MSFSRKIGVGAVVVALVGAGLGAATAVSLTQGRAPREEAPLAVITTRHEAGAGVPASTSTDASGAARGDGSVAMVTTRPASSVPSSPLLASREADRLASPSLSREARAHRVDGRGGEGLRVRRLVVSTGVERREPTGEGDRFDGQDPRLYAFVDLANRGDATEVEVSFEPEVASRDAHVTGLVTLEVPAEVGRHRTWAWSRNVHAPGHWFAVVRDLEGHELARTPFTIE